MSPSSNSVTSTPKTHAWVGRASVSCPAAVAAEVPGRAAAARSGSRGAHLSTHRTGAHAPILRPPSVASSRVQGLQAAEGPSSLTFSVWRHSWLSPLEQWLQNCPRCISGLLPARFPDCPPSPTVPPRAPKARWGPLKIHILGLFGVGHCRLRHSLFLGRKGQLSWHFKGLSLQVPTPCPYTHTHISSPVPAPQVSYSFTSR